MLSHPTGTRYFASRNAARTSCGRSERVVRLGSFAWGSFGCYGQLTQSGQPVGASVGGQPPQIIIWAVIPKATKQCSNGRPDWR